jgi:hypothetical protein
VRWVIAYVLAAIKNSYKPLCKQESDNLWCQGKLLISIKRAMNSSRIELLWLVWDQSRSKYYSTFFISVGVPNGEFPEILIAKCRSRFYCTWFFVGGTSCGRKRCVREINVSRAWDPVHAGDKALLHLYVMEIDLIFIFEISKKVWSLHENLTLRWSSTSPDK